MILNFEFPGIPTAKQSVRVGPVYNKSGEPVVYTGKDGKNKVLIRKYKGKKIEDKERSLVALIKEQLPADFKIWVRGVKVLKLTYIFPPLKGFSKKAMNDIALGRTHYKTTKPDITDNLAKMLFDCLEGIVYINDSQICEMYDVKKIYGFQPGIYLTIEGE